LKKKSVLCYLQRYTIFGNLNHPGNHSNTNNKCHQNRSSRLGTMLNRHTHRQTNINLYIYYIEKPYCRVVEGFNVHTKHIFTYTTNTAVICLPIIFMIKLVIVIVIFYSTGLVGTYNSTNNADYTIDIFVIRFKNILYSI